MGKMPAACGRGKNRFIVPAPGQRRPPVRRRARPSSLVQALRSTRMSRWLRMDQAPTMLPADLSLLLGAASAPTLVDLRPAAETSDQLIPGALRRLPADVQSWRSD